MTKKHIARAERDRVLRNRILGGTIIAGTLVIGLLAYGWYQAKVVQPNRPVAIVNGKEILTEELQTRVRFGQWNLVNQIRNLQQFMVLIGDNPDLLANYQGQLVSLQQQLSNREILGSTQLNLLIEEQLIFEEAKRRGIAVSEAEVDRAIEEAFGFFVAGASTSEASPSPVATRSAAASAEEGEPGPSPTPSDASTPQPTPTLYTRELFQANYQAYLGNLKTFKIDEGDVRDQWRARLLRERLQKEFISQVSSFQEQVWARHIVVADEALAAELLERVMNGESWEELAADFSLDESNKNKGGDLGWFARGRMVEPFEQAAFEAEIDQIVGPIETDFGWHIIEVLGHEMRELDPSDLELEISRVFNEWLAAQVEAADIVILDDWAEALPAPPLLTP